MSRNNNNYNNGEHESSSYEFESDINLEYCSVLDIESNLEVEHYIDVCIDIEGNEAVFAVDVQAFGNDTSTELNLIVVVTDDWSSITATGYAAVA